VNEKNELERLDGYISNHDGYISNGGACRMKVFLDVLPDGKHYGFPKEVPESLVTKFGGEDYGLKPGWRKWATEQGYPGVDGKNVKWVHYYER